MSEDTYFFLYKDLDGEKICGNDINTHYVYFCIRKKAI